MIDATLVELLVTAQFPQWASLPIRPVAAGGIDNRTFHLGDEMTVRLPSAEGYAASIEKEQRWLPWLAPQLPLEIPVPLAMGEPAFGYPYDWSIYRWLPGQTASASAIADLTGFAVDLAGFLNALHAIDSGGGPLAGKHSWYRGAALSHYDSETRDALSTLDIPGAQEIWETALDARWEGSPVWFHGDIAHGNLLVQDGKLSAVIDFGTSGTGDPSCDLVIAWTFLSGENREAFAATVLADDAMWARARGWALWKALITRDHRVIREVLSEDTEDSRS